MRWLTDQERVELEAQIKRTKDVSEWKRLFVILTYDEGLSIEELAKFVRLSPWTVEQYLKEYSARDKTKNDPKGGSSSKLSEREASELEDHLSKITYRKVKDIVAYTEGRFGKQYSRTGMTAWLKDRGFTFKRPEKVPGKLDPGRQAAFIEKYRKLKSSMGPRDDLYFLDEVHPEYQSQAVYGWIKKGECKTLPTTGNQKRFHFMGALCLKEMKVMIREYRTIDAEATVHFLKNLQEESPAEKIHVILDNAGPHKNQRIERFLRESPRIKLHYLPPYSPNLNPIERLWKVFREITLYNRYFSTCFDFSTAVRDFFGSKVYKLRRLLRRRINDNFQIIKLNPIQLG